MSSTKLTSWSTFHENEDSLFVPQSCCWHGVSSRPPKNLCCFQYFTCLHAEVLRGFGSGFVENITVHMPYCQMIWHLSQRGIKLSLIRFYRDISENLLVIINSMAQQRSHSLLFCPWPDCCELHGNLNITPLATSTVYRFSSEICKASSVSALSTVTSKCRNGLIAICYVDQFELLLRQSFVLLLWPLAKWNP